MRRIQIGIVTAVLALTGVQIAMASELKTLLAAQTLTDLESQAHVSTALTLAHEGCTAELAARLLPRSCFRELAMMKSTDSRDTRLERLERVCVQNARQSRSRLDLSASKSDLPKACASEIERRLEDLQYKDEAVSPETSVMRTSGPDLEVSSLK